MNTEKNKPATETSGPAREDVELKRWEGGSLPHEATAFDDAGDPPEPTGAARRVNAPHAKPAEPLSEDTMHDHLEKKARHAEDRQEALIDEGVEETFPASDPVSVKRIT